MHTSEAEGPNAAAKFALAYQRLREQDEERRAWLDAKCRRPDPDEERGGDRFVPEIVTVKTDGVPGRCKAWGCHRKARAKGWCDTHYRRAMRDGRTVREYRASRKANAA